MSGTRSHMNLGGAGDTQNQGNVLGDRPCVRQSKNYRQHLGGNAMKAMLGQDNLCWNTNQQEGAYAGKGVWSQDGNAAAAAANLQQHQQAAAGASKNQQYQAAAAAPIDVREQQRLKLQDAHAQPQQKVAAAAPVQPTNRRFTGKANQSSFTLGESA